MEEGFFDVASVQWPKRDKDPTSEFQTGYFYKAFPDLFPFGKGDNTKARLKKNPTLSAYFAHLCSVPICPETTYWHSQKMKLTRRILPIIIGYALNIHKLQSNTRTRG